MDNIIISINNQNYNAQIINQGDNGNFILQEVSGGTIQFKGRDFRHIFNIKFNEDNFPRDIKQNQDITITYTDTNRQIKLKAAEIEIIDDEDLILRLLTPIVTEQKKHSEINQSA